MYNNIIVDIKGKYGRYVDIMWQFQFDRNKTSSNKVSLLPKRYLVITCRLMKTSCGTTWVGNTKIAPRPMAMSIL